MLAPVVLTLALASLGADPTPASSTSRRVDLGAGLYYGDLLDAKAGVGGFERAGGLELELLAAFRRFALGGRLFTMGTPRGGVGLAVTGGPRLPLTEALRLDLALDAGFMGHTSDDGQDSPALLPAIGARAGLRWGRRPGLSLAFGALVRWTGTRSIDVRDELGNAAGSAVTAGGTVVGAFVTVGYARGNAPP